VRTAADLADGIRELVVEGRDAWRHGNYERAWTLFEAALRVAEGRDDAFGRMSALHFLGNVAFNQRRDDESRALHGEALAVARADCDEHGIATSLGSIALVDVADGDFDAAARRFAESAAAYEQAGMSDDAARVRRTAHDLLDRRMALDMLVDRVRAG
jgi:tetratricopeptide (TPR) repeat protein